MALKEAMREHVKGMLLELLDDETVWQEFDKEMELASRQGLTSTISFTGGEARVITGGEMPAVYFNLEPEISIEDYSFCGEPLSDGQVEDILDQIKGIDNFIEKLNQAKARLRLALTSRG